MVATHNASAVIVDCLTALCAQQDIQNSEIIVADSSSDDTPHLIGKFPDVRLLHFDQPLTVPELRGRGIAVARGGVIAILDPFSIVGVRWKRELLQAHTDHSPLVIGGAVELHQAVSRTLFAWALYINEYGLFMPPVAGGDVGIVPGCNVSYKRTALFDGDRPRFGVFWKTFVNWDLQAAGSALWLAPEVLVELSKPVPFGDFLLSRFDHGRCFAAMRGAEWRWPRRLFHATASPVLPLVMVWRWSRTFWAKRRYRQKLLFTLPLQLLLFGFWAAGECWGYLAGRGRSCRRLFY